MLVPILILLVIAAIWASEVNASSDQDSPIVIQSYPSSSARSARSRVTLHSLPGGLRPISPTLTISSLPALSFLKSSIPVLMEVVVLRLYCGTNRSLPGGMVCHFPIGLFPPRIQVNPRM